MVLGRIGAKQTRFDKIMFNVVVVGLVLVNILIIILGIKLMIN